MQRFRIRRAFVCRAVIVFVFVFSNPGKAAPSPPRRLNLLLITLDTVRADHLGCYGFKSAETPNLDRLAREGVRFEYAESVAPLTLPSHSTILSGLLPPHHGVHKNGSVKFPDGVETLATLASAAGYRTAAFVSSFVLDHRFGLARGFATYDDDIRFDKKELDSPGAQRLGAITLDRALAWLDGTGDRPFFAWVHLYDAHVPYKSPEPFRGRHPDSSYDGAIAFEDFQVGRLFDWLKHHSLAQSTLVAVVADHGESLGEHRESTHGFFLYEATLRVPMLIKLPGVIRPGQEIRTPVSLVDLAPTLATLLRTPFSIDRKIDGRDLSESLRANSEPARADLFAEAEVPASFGWSGLTALRQGRLKYIEAPRPELYDLFTDAMETVNLYSPDRPRADLARRLSEFRQNSVQPESAPPDSEGARKLASLGYIAGSTREASGGGKADPKDRIGAYREYEAAKLKVEAGKYDEAIALLKRLTAADPHNPIFQAALAFAYGETDDFTRAVAAYRKVVAETPEDSRAHFNLGSVLYNSGKLDEALAELEKSLALYASSFEAHNLLGLVYSEKKRKADALAEFDRAAAIDPLNARVENNRGNTLREVGRTEEAVSAYQKSIALSATYPDPWNGLGVVELAKNRPLSALFDFNNALRLSPGFHLACLNRAIALQATGDRGGAIAGLREFLKRTENDTNLKVERETARKLLEHLTSGVEKNE